MAEHEVDPKPAQRKLRGLFLLDRPRARRLGHCLIAVATLGFAACATLPDVDRALAEPHTRTVEFEDSRGPVAPGTAEIILDRLEAESGTADALAQHLAYEQSVNVDSPLVLGNKLTLLQDGPATYAAMFADIRAARDHINLETYIFAEDATGQQFADLLMQRQADGVQVNIIFDSFGSMQTSAAFFERMRSAGIRVLEFHPLNPLLTQKEWRISHRDHRKQLIIDGRIAFTGGINISEEYSSAPSGGGRHKQHAAQARDDTGWRDTHVRIEGPVVAEFQKLFLDTWQRQRADPLAERNYFPELPARGGEIVRAIGSTPDAEQSLIYLTLISAITHARTSIHLTIAYFAPDEQLLDALKDAARRGVKVDLLLPSVSDAALVFHLGRSHYRKLLRAGVRIHERRGSVMHAKTACVDSVWSTVGSTNLDWRSFVHNDEVNAVVLGADFARQMEAAFAADVAASNTITLREWRRRSLLSRLKERFARIGARWL